MKFGLNMVYSRGCSGPLWTNSCDDFECRSPTLPNTIFRWNLPRCFEDETVDGHDIQIMCLFYANNA